MSTQSHNTSLASLQQAVAEARQAAIEAEAQGWLGNNVDTQFMRRYKNLELQLWQLEVEEAIANINLGENK